MYIHKTASYYLTNVILGAFLIICAVFCLYPIIYIVFASFSDPLLLAQHTGLLLYPLKPSIKGYQRAMSFGNIWTGYYTTIRIVVLGTLVNMFVTTTAAYAVSRRDALLCKFLNMICIITMFFGGGLIPTYLVVKNIGLIDNLLALIIPVALNTWNLIILRVAMQSLPASLLESARIDGASDFMILFKIVIPLVKATLAVVAFYYVVGHWNSWFNAMIFMRTRDKYPLQLILREVLVASISNMGQQSTGALEMSELDNYKQLVKYCTTVIATVPILFIFPFFQKYFVKGVLVGSIKG
jgi:putative aldouronate transport system permease protein